MPNWKHAIYGGYMWAEHAAEQLGINLLSPSDDFLLRISPEYTCRPIRPSTVEVQRAAWGIFPLFIKSLHGKQLDSRVYRSATDIPDVGDDVKVIVQKPVRWTTEFRLFILNNEIVTSSQYATDGALDIKPTDPDADFVISLFVDQFLLDNVGNVPSAFVLDVGWIEGRGMAIVEANPAWCSSVYACDPDRVLDVVAAACKPGPRSN